MTDYVCKKCGKVWSVSDGCLGKREVESCFDCKFDDYLNKIGL